MPEPTLTVTLIPASTLEPQQARDAIGALLRGSMDCLLPCFWGIVPGQTRLDDAREVFRRLGLELQFTGTQNGEDFYALLYDAESGLRVSPVLEVKADIVQNINIGMVPEEQQTGVRREWLAYSPETLIGRYGPPTKVDFVVDRGAPDISYAMRMYFQAQDLILEYYAYHIGVGLQACPLTDQFDSVRAWMGKEAVNPPRPGVPLEEAASLTMEEFVQLMTGSPQEACIKLKVEAFP